MTIIKKGKLPPPMEPAQLIALFDAMLPAGGSRKMQGGRAIYSFSVDDVYEADDILAGLFWTDEEREAHSTAK